MVSQTKTLHMMATIIGFFLIAAGADKVFHLNAFNRTVSQYWFLPSQWSLSIAITVILLELFFGICLLSRSIRHVASLAAAIMLIVLTIGSVLQKYFVPLSECGCWYSIAKPDNFAIHTLLNILIIWSLFQIHNYFNLQRKESNQ